MTEVLVEFPHLKDPRSGKPLMDRTVLVANTSNMLWPTQIMIATVFIGVLAPAGWGGLVSALAVVLKGLPSTYDKDLQEDKEPAFDTFNTLQLVMPVLAGLVRSLEVRPQVMAARLLPGLLATDMADELVRRGVPFREAHGLVGALVKRAEALGVALTDVSYDERSKISEHFTEQMWATLDFEQSLQRRAQTGGTARAALEAQLVAARAAIGA